jgi:hypothetical protein
MQVVEWSENIVTPKYYIVKVSSMQEDEVDIKGEGGKTISLKVPITRNDPVSGLTEEGVVKNAPRNGNQNLIGRRIKFWFTNTDFTMKSGINIPGHVLVPDYDIIQVDDEMYGDYIYCKPIEKKYGSLYLPTIQMINYDSLQAPKQEWSDIYLDKGIVARKNKWHGEGEYVFWGNPGRARQNWEQGFLIKAKYIDAIGDDVPKMMYVKGK